jgi:hypothetical protein
MGYAAAQSQLAAVCRDDENESFVWAEKAASQNDRLGLYELGSCYEHGRGCAQDRSKTLELYRRAAELGLSVAQQVYGELAFGEDDWERYYWWGGAACNHNDLSGFRLVVIELLPLFERGDKSRILFTVAPMVKANAVESVNVVFGRDCSREEMVALLRVVELNDAMLGRARLAIACWSVAGRRCGLIKDVRVMIAKMLWEEAWRWGRKSFGNV